MDRRSLKPSADNAPAWVGIGVTVLLFALGAGITGLIRAGNTEAKVETNTNEIREMRAEQREQGKDVAYIRARIDGFSQREAERVARERGLDGN